MTTLAETNPATGGTWFENSAMAGRMISAARLAAPPLTHACATTCAVLEPSRARRRAIKSRYAAYTASGTAQQGSAFPASAITITVGLSSKNSRSKTGASTTGATRQATAIPRAREPWNSGTRLLVPLLSAGVATVRL
jgi:hypothetical protein